MDKQIFIVFFSASGTTRLVAETIQEGFARKDVTVTLHALGHSADDADLLNRLFVAGSHAALFIGSPVYRDGAAPAVMGFLKNLPMTDGAAAVPFATWGKACSGLALWQMGKGLTAKGFSLAGAAKVLAVHSLMWRQKNPPGGGHPDLEDRRQLLGMVDVLWDRFESGRWQPIPLERLDYQPAAQSGQIKEKIAAPWRIVPKTADQNACTHCGLCEQECPVGAVALNPYPEFGDNCCDCFNCIRLCPEGAIEPAVSMDRIEKHILERVRTIDEHPDTEIFL